MSSLENEGWWVQPRTHTNIFNSAQVMPSVCLEFEGWRCALWIQISSTKSGVSYKYCRSTPLLTQLFPRAYARVMTRPAPDPRVGSCGFQKPTGRDGPGRVGPGRRGLDGPIPPDKRDLTRFGNSFALILQPKKTSNYYGGP